MFKWTFFTFAAGLTIVLCLLVSANAQVAPSGFEIQTLSPEELEAKATNVVTGHLSGIYRRHIVEDGGTTAILIAEVLVKKVIKGDYSKPGQIVYLKFWVRSPTAMKRNPALDPGYAISPRMEGEVKCYFNIQEDGICQVLKPNGIEAYVETSESKE